jgi:cytochrome c55X
VVYRAVDLAAACAMKFRAVPRLCTTTNVLVLAGMTIACCPAMAAGDVPMDAARRQELIRLVRQDCGSCHGLTLQGGLGPSLLPEALAGKPAGALKATILFGRPGTAMPPWRRFLDEAEAEWIVTNLQKGFPDEIQGR